MGWWCCTMGRAMWRRVNSSTCCRFRAWCEINLIRRRQPRQTRLTRTIQLLNRARARMLACMIFNAVIERDIETGLLVGSVPGLPGAHTQGATIEEVRANLSEVIALLREQGELRMESEFIATTPLMVA